MSQQETQGRRSLVGFALVLILGAFLAMFFVQPGAPLQEGVRAPSFELSDLDGEMVSLSSLRGKVVVLDFWATTCPPCIRQMQELERVHQRYHRDVVVLGINGEPVRADMVRAFVRERGGVRYRILVGGSSVSERYRVSALPSLYLLDAAGVVRWSRAGYASAQEIEAALRPLLSPGGKR